MSFADQLRNAPNEKAKEEEQKRKEMEAQKERDWNRLINNWVKRTEDVCKSHAEKGETSCVPDDIFSPLTFSRFAWDYNYKYSDLTEENVDEKDRDEFFWWFRIQSRIAHNFTNGNKYSLTPEDTEKCESDLRKIMEERDGLTLSIQREEVKTYHRERKYVSSPGFLDKLSGDFHLDENDRWYKYKTIQDGVRYDLHLTISW